MLDTNRDLFHIPKQANGEEQTYLCGHSLGLQPKSAQRYIQQELQDWAEQGVRGHFVTDTPWLSYHELVTPHLAKLVGARPEEVVAMNSLTTNLHLLLVSFYRPTKTKYKILIEKNAFPSDRYAVQSHAKWHGYDDSAVIYFDAHSEHGNEHGLVDTAKLLSFLEEQGDDIALLLLPGVQFLCGQVLAMESITQVAHGKEMYVGFDLAHAVGNIPLQLHHWAVDFAVWCHYKYVNAGPGAIGGCFVHQRHHASPQLPRLAGWWGHDKATRFAMPEQFNPIHSVEAWQLSNPPIFQLAALRASLEIFTEVGMEPLRQRSCQLMANLCEQLRAEFAESIHLLTPEDPQQRGAQLSFAVNQRKEEVHQQLQVQGVICDFREPNVIRLALAPLYNQQQDIDHLVYALRQIL